MESIKQVDEKTIEFTLKKGLKWEKDYGEVTAEDVKFSFERFNIKAEGGDLPTYAKDWGALDHVEVTDTYSGKIILKNPAPALWLIALADVSGCIVCKKAWEELGAEKMKTTSVGSGPYTLAEWKPNESITLRANPDYSGTAPPAFKEIVLRPIEETKTAQLAFRSDEVHFTGSTIPRLPMRSPTTAAPTSSSSRASITCGLASTSRRSRSTTSACGRRSARRSTSIKRSSPATTAR